MSDRAVDRIALVFFGALATAAVGLVLFLGYLVGYGVGLWAAPCTIESAQPKCVQAGWGTHNRVTIERGRRP